MTDYTYKGPAPLYVSNSNQSGMHDLNSWFANNNLLSQASPNDQALWSSTPGARDSIVGSTLQSLGWNLAPGNKGLIAPWAPQGWTPPQNQLGSASFWDMHPGQSGDQAMQNMNQAMGLPGNWSLGANSTQSQANSMFGGNPMATGTIPGAVTQGNLVSSGISPQENLLQQLFQGSATGQGSNPIAQQLYSLGMGQLPQPMTDQITATTNEQFGKLGSRFGTDLATAISRGLGQAGAGQSLQAINQILGLGNNATNFQFSRGENALQRGLSEYQTDQQTDPMQQLLRILLGG